jgi:putative intracellular protease/amidase
MSKCDRGDRLARTLWRAELRQHRRCHRGSRACGASAATSLWARPRALEGRATVNHSHFRPAPPDGADYIVVPALEPRNNQYTVDWIVTQHRKGAKIFSVCAGSLTLAAAGLLDGRPATTHWALHRRPKEGASRHAVGARPTLCDGRWYQHIDWHHRIDPGDGRSKAEQLARDLGVANWDATGCRSGATRPLEFP